MWRLKLRSSDAQALIDPGIAGGIALAVFRSHHVLAVLQAHV